MLRLGAMLLDGEHSPRARSRHQLGNLCDLSSASAWITPAAALLFDPKLSSGDPGAGGPYREPSLPQTHMPQDGLDFVQEQGLTQPRLLLPLPL